MIMPLQQLLKCKHPPTASGPLADLVAHKWLYTNQRAGCPLQLASNEQHVTGDGPAAGSPTTTSQTHLMWSPAAAGS